MRTSRMTVALVCGFLFGGPKPGVEAATLPAPMPWQGENCHYGAWPRTASATRSAWKRRASPGNTRFMPVMFTSFRYVSPNIGEGEDFKQQVAHQHQRKVRCPVLIHTYFVSKNTFYQGDLWSPVAHRYWKLGKS